MASAPEGDWLHALVAECRGRPIVDIRDKLTVCLHGEKFLKTPGGRSTSLI
jgi:hypothetical protein